MEKPASAKPIDGHTEAMAFMRASIASAMDWQTLIGDGP